MTKAVTVLRTTLKKWKKLTVELLINCAKMIEVIRTRPPDHQFQLTTRLTVLFLYVAPPPLSCPLIICGRRQSLDKCLTPTSPAQLLASETKQTLLSTILLSLLALEWQAAGPTFGEK